MSTQHPITPPPELVEQWRFDYLNRYHPFIDVATRIAQWGADQELDECCEWIRCPDTMHLGSSDLRTARRPKPPSLKEQAIGALGRFNTNAHTVASEMVADLDTIRRALEALND